MLYAIKSFRNNRLVALYAMNVFVAFLLLLFAEAHSAPVEADEKITLDIESIDHDHQLFSAHFQKVLLTQSLWKSPIYKNVNTLSLAVKEHLNKNNGVLAANTIFNNISLLYENYDSAEIFRLVQVLLDQNDTESANALFKLIKEQGDQALISNTAYVFAVYSFSKNKWEKTLGILNGILSDLPDENYQHALLMQGISLQKTNKHRKSIESYTKIKPSSEYYASARLNMAIANIKQGWWTDGNSIIQKTLKLPSTLKQEEALNRLYLTLGYSFMNQGYYRNSRDSFRNIGIDSLLANQALLGIALTAANQKDYVGALSSIRILQKKNTFELTVDESYLLMPYFYEKLQQPTTASTGYLEAISYYQKRIADIQSIINSEINLQKNQINVGINTSLKINDNPITFSNEYPNYVFINYLNLNNYSKYLKLIDNTTIQTEYAQLKNKYKTIIQTMVREILKKRINHLNSYMDQSRLGLARLYDNNLVGNQ